MTSRNTSADSPFADKGTTFGQDVADRASEARDSMSEMARTAARKVDDGRSVAADRLDSAAATVQERAQNLPGGPRVKEFATAAADRLSTTADYMRNHDAKRMVADVEAVVKNHPGPALLIAAAVGFVVGRALSRD